MSVVVLGMHRSGTSALTRCVNLMGLSVGRDEDLLPANEENPRGFWENTHLTELNDSILETMGGFWNAPPDLDGEWWRDPRLDEQRERARELLERGGFHADTWCWKDPRNCLTLPFWLDLLPTDPVVIFIRRHPLEIWKSLERRNGLSKSHALSLWYIYSSAALRGLESLPFYSLEYEQLLEAPMPVLARIRNFLAANGIADVAEPPVEEIEAFLSRDLKHWRYDAGALLDDPDIHPAKKELFAQLEALPETATGPRTLGWQPELPTDSSHRIVCHLDAYQSRNQSHDALREEYEQRVDGLNQHLENTRAACDLRIETLEEDHEAERRIDRQVRERMQSIVDQVGDRVPGGPAPHSQGEPCDILIPIYNAHDHVQRCVESVLEHTDPRHPVYLLDDASPDERILLLLEDFAERDARVRVIEAPENLGFIGNVNRGFELSRHDVVILNSDTEVTPGWLERLRECLASDERIGVVSPLSNNATILSVPVMNEDNALPPDQSPQDFAALVAHASARLYPRIPTAVGFCMMISRRALDALGRFDSAYGQGYGEECDFCMRAWRDGFEVVCCDDAYVHHYGEASFGELGDLDERRLRSQRLLDLFWPQYHRTVYGFCHANPMREVQERVKTAIERHAGARRPHVMQVVHSYETPGGTELHTRQLVDGLSGRYRSTVLYPDSQPGVWADMVEEERRAGERIVRLCRENVRSNEFFVHQPADLEGVTVEANFARLIAGSDADIVHFQHLTGFGSIYLPFIAKALGKRVVLTLHDYYLMCPEYNLVTPQMERCGKSHADHRDEDCFKCLGDKRFVHDEGRQVLMHEYLRERYLLMRKLVEEVDAIVTPSAFARDQVRRAFGERLGDRVQVIPHGIVDCAPSPRPERAPVLRVGFLGNMTDRKGGIVLLEAAQRLMDRPVRFQVFGGVPPAFERPAAMQGLILRGPYEPSELPELLSEVDLVLVPSVWDETYCLTVSEAQAMGVPVMATDVGAISERITDGRNGFLIPAGDPEALAMRLAAIAADPRSLEPIIAELATLRQKSVPEMVEEYDALYARMLANRDAGDLMLRTLLGVGDGTGDENAAPITSLAA